MENWIVELGCIFGVVIIIELAFILSAVNRAANGTQRTGNILASNVEGHRDYELRVKAER